ncbi:phosphonate C-P lyase system protein PhnH [Sagittula salina]|uniref:Phosphonate C-P lyase system protein PhnH n=1 Tax=Sagittula salina TaxID=2820268 RepID=A0A940MRD6_9RHOB|nr:phosphonate C-P lyase system protein PhnH [Sagittula salina]MBP0484440.1 phosphonate C-P lyase system protein PhnH [Sagittula salina]
MQAQPLEGGFATPATQSAQAFRAVMQAMAMPGTIHALAGARPPAPLSPAAGAVLLTLCDADTGLYLAGDCDTPEVRAWIAFHTGAPLTGPECCAFALGDWAALQPLHRFPPGTPEYPDRSATLIVERARLDTEGAILTGPGIRDSAALSLPGVDAIAINHARFPLGLDFIFTCGDRVAALPRSTEVA